jgi:HK97 family phage prohead protease
MNGLETKTRAFEVKAADGGEGGAVCTFEGLGGVCLNLDWKGDVVDPGAFARDIAFTRERGKVRDEHGVTTGRLVDASDRAEGLYVKGLILPTSAGNDQAVLVKGKAVDRLSIGYATLAKEWLSSPDEVKSYWSSKGYAPTEDDLLALGAFGGARLLTRVRVYEVSTTWLPTNDKAAITGVKSGARAGRSFADHSDQVLAAVGEFLERAEGVAKLRAESGRSLGPEAKSRLTQLQTRLSGLLSSLEAKSQAPEPEPVQTFDALYAGFLAACARLDGLID